MVAVAVQLAVVGTRAYCCSHLMTINVMRCDDGDNVLCVNARSFYVPRLCRQVMIVVVFVGRRIEDLQICTCTGHYSRVIALMLGISLIREERNQNGRD